jgi:hypothetical protein
MVRRCCCIVLDANRKKPRPVVKTNKQEQSTSTSKSKSKEHKTESTRPTWYVPKEQWQKLSQEQQDAYVKKHKKSRKVHKTKTMSKSDTQNPSTDSTASDSHTKLAPTSTAIQKFMSAQNAKPSSETKNVTLKLSATKMSYCTSVASVTKSGGSLIDGGANGGLAGADVRLISTGNMLADVTGINNSIISDVPIGTVAGVIDTTDGPAIAVMHQYAYVGSGTTIHSVNQLTRLLWSTC